LYPRFGRELRRVRRQKKVTQNQLAERVKLGRTSIVNIERGRQRIHLHTFLEFARALQVDPRELLPDEPTPVPEIAGEVANLPGPERDWVLRVVSPSRTQEETKGSDGAKA
jgi:transcriptional regulator with XRE-family HTH domain